MLLHQQKSQVNAILSRHIANNSIVGADISATTQITASTFTGALTGNVTGNVAGNLTGTIQTAAQTNITSVGTLSALTVSGQLTAGGLSYPTSDGTNEQVLRTDGSGNLSFGTISGTTLNNNTNNYVMTGTGTANTLNGEANLIFDGTSLGIGTNTPTAYNSSDKLALVSSGNTSLAIAAGTSGESSIFMADGTSGTASYMGYLQYHHSDNHLRIGVNATERMRIDSSGNVGIGNASPQVNFVVGDGTNGTGLEVTPNESSGYVNMNAYDRGSSAWRTMNIGGDVVTLNTGGTERMRIAGNNLHLNGGTDARIQLGTGGAGANQVSNNTVHIRGDGADMKLMAASGGIYQFEQNGTERFRIQAGGGISFNGDTAAANALDDYEEGTWTPALSGVTTTSSTMYGIYTKIGNICHIHAKIEATVASLPGATFVITGIPFTAENASDANQRAIIHIGGDAANIGSNAFKAHFRTNSSNLSAMFLNSSTTYMTYNTMDHTTFELNIHGFYRTT